MILNFNKNSELGKIMKKLKTILLAFAIINAGILLYISGYDWHNSLSSFALSDNVLYYRLMHLSIVSFFLLDSRENKLSYYVAFGMAMVLAFDMFHYFWLHTIFTAGSLAFACFALIYNNKGFNRNVMIFNSAGAVLVFCIGYFETTFHFLMAEIIAMIFIVVGKLREVWKL